MNRYKYLFFIVIFFFGNVLLFSQTEMTKLDPTGWKKADRLYQQQGYMASASRYQLKQDIDDMNPEAYEPLIDALFTAGAGDVYLTPIIMITFIAVVVYILRWWVNL